MNFTRVVESTQVFFLHPANSQEGLILLILHMHIYFRYIKTRYTSKLYRILDRILDISGCFSMLPVILVYDFFNASVYVYLNELLVCMND